MLLPARCRHYGRRSTGARSGARGVGLLLEQGFEQAPQLAVTSRLASLAQVVGNIQLSCAALSNAGAAHIDVCPSMLDVEALAVGVEDEMPLVLVIQDGPSGGPVQLSFQQSHAHMCAPRGHLSSANPSLAVGTDKAARNQRAIRQGSSNRRFATATARRSSPDWHTYAPCWPTPFDRGVPCYA